MERYYDVGMGSTSVSSIIGSCQDSNSFLPVFFWDYPCVLDTSFSIVGSCGETIMSSCDPTFTIASYVLVGD